MGAAPPEARQVEAQQAAVLVEPQADTPVADIAVAEVDTLAADTVAGIPAEASGDIPAAVSPVENPEAEPLVEQSEAVPSEEALSVEKLAVVLSAVPEASSVVVPAGWSVDAQAAS